MRIRVGLGLDMRISLNQKDVDYPNTLPSLISVFVIHDSLLDVYFKPLATDVDQVDSDLVWILEYRFFVTRPRLVG